MKAWTIAAAAAAGLMSLSLLSAPASADGRGHWGGNSYNSYSRNNDCNDRSHYSRGHHRDHGDWNRHRGDRRFSWNDRRWDNDWRDNNRRRGDHRWRQRDRDHDGDHDRRRRDRRWD